MARMTDRRTFLKALDNQGRWPGDAYFEPMWQELNRRRALPEIQGGQQKDLGGIP
jgi:hypothetical protein